MTRSAKSAVANALPPPTFALTGTTTTQTELWQFDAPCGKLLESTAVAAPAEATLRAYTVALLGEDVLIPGAYAWAVVVRNPAAWFDSEKPVEFQILTRDPVQVNFQVLYSDDVTCLRRWRMPACTTFRMTCTIACCKRIRM